jgi:hypothetical protein
MRLLSAAMLCLLFASCATTQESSFASSSKDGASIDSAILINEKSEVAGVQAEYHWIGLHYPNYKRGAQAVLNKNGRMYDRIEFTTSGGDSKVVYFDITDFFGKL